LLVVAEVVWATLLAAAVVVVPEDIELIRGYLFQQEQHIPSPLVLEALEAPAPVVLELLLTMATTLCLVQLHLPAAVEVGNITGLRPPVVVLVAALR
jgi:hypothetical protein